MTTGMGVTNPKLAKGGRKLKKEKTLYHFQNLEQNEKKRAFELRENNLK